MASTTTGSRTHDVGDLAADLMPSSKKTKDTKQQQQQQQQQQQSAGATTATDEHRAMDSTRTWKPSLDRRQSWNKEDHKHALQMSPLGEPGKPGFTEGGR